MVVEGDFVVEVKSTLDSKRYVVFNSDHTNCRMAALAVRERPTVKYTTVRRARTGEAQALASAEKEYIPASA